MDSPLYPLEGATCRSKTWDSLQSHSAATGRASLSTKLITWVAVISWRGCSDLAGLSGSQVLNLLVCLESLICKPMCLQFNLSKRFLQLTIKSKLTKIFSWEEKLKVRHFTHGEIESEEPLKILRMFCISSKIKQ